MEDNEAPSTSKSLTKVVKQTNFFYQTRMRTQGPLLTLPALVLDQILEECNPTTLRTLRLVCKDFKQLVDQPKHLQKLEISILFPKNVNEVKRETKVPWLSFRIYFDDYTKFSMSHLSSCFKTIRHLNLHKSPEVFTISELTPVLNENLETLALNSIYLDLKTTYGVTETFDRSKIKLSNLKSLSIVKVSGSAQNFGCFLKDSWKLETLELPRYQGEERAAQDALASFLFSSLQEYLQLFQKNCKNKRRTLKLDFLNFLPYANLRRVTILEMMRKPELSQKFNDLVQICSLTGAQLYNVPEWYLPGKNDRIKNLPAFDAVIKSVRIHNFPKDLFLIPTDAKVHMNIEVYITRDPEDDDGEDDYIDNQTQYDTFAMFIITHWRQIPETLTNNLRGVFRPSVSKLSIHSCQPDNGIGSGFLLAKNYPNLVELKIQGWGVDGDFQDLWRGLPNLKTLSLLYCLDLTDAGLIGPEPGNPLLLQMKNLSSLSMARTNVTDASFTRIFRYMKLKTFIWTHQSSANVSFRRGMSSLGTIDGGFKDTIETFEVSRPGLDKCKDNTIKALKKSFPCIRVFKIHDE